MFELSDDNISSRTSQTSYQRGLFYFFSGRVSEFKYDENTNSINAIVIGTKPYNTRIDFSSDGNIADCFCSCNNIANTMNLCKHQVAVLKQLQIEYSKKSRQKRLLENYSQNILKYFNSNELANESSKKDINLTVEFISSSERNMYLNALRLKIGFVHLYTVKNMKEFIEAVNSKQVIDFGKKFVYNPTLQKFNDKSQKIIDIISELWELDKLNSENVYNKSLLLNQRHLLLSNYAFKKIIKILENDCINININNTLYENVMILSEKLPIEFSFSTLEMQNIELKITNVEKYIPLTSDGSLFFYANKIYILPAIQSNVLFPFFKVIQNKIPSIFFNASERDNVISNIVPSIQGQINVKLSPDIEKNIVQEELVPEIYLDLIEDNLTLKAKFIYGAYEINPFDNTTAVKTAQIIMRDIPKESSIMTILENSELKVNKNFLYLDNDASIYDFVKDTLPSLQNVAQVFYSEAFKNISIKDKPKLSVGIRLGLDKSTLYLDINYGEIPPEELADMFHSFAIKKKYYKLKDGSFLPLDEETLTSINDIFEQMNINEKAWDKNTIELPLNSAMYLNSKLEGSQLISYNKAKEFNSIVDDINNPVNCEIEIPDKLKELMREYQLVGFKWLKTLSHYHLGGILADDMGLGKTLQSIAFIYSEVQKNNNTSIVICPSSLVYNWLDEINKFTPDLKALAILGDIETRQGLIEKCTEYQLIITSYALIRRDIDLYKNIGFAFCFIDEAQNIKNPASLNSRAVKQIKAQNYFALTGTPIENSLTELWSIFDYIMPNYLLSHSKFTQKYEKPIIREQNKDALAELSKQIKPFILRRMKKDVLKELPEKIETKLYSELTPEQNKIYLAYMHNIQTSLAQEIAINGYEKSKIKILACLTRLRQICCHPAMFIENYQHDSGKLELLMEIVLDLLQSNHRILIFSQFTSMLKIISNRLNYENIMHYYLDGTTKLDLRNDYVKKFNSGVNEVFLISLKAGGTGLNLTGADVVIHFDPWWNPAVEQQATDRVYRIGQNNKVQVIKLVTKNTIEEKIYDLQSKKQDLINSVIMPGETFINKMSEDEIKNLFDLT